MAVDAEIGGDYIKTSDKIAEMASKLNTDEGSLLDSLKDALPQIIDKSSSGGSLLSAEGLMGMAKKFF